MYAKTVTKGEHTVVAETFRQRNSGPYNRFSPSHEYVVYVHDFAGKLPQTKVAIVRQSPKAVKGETWVLLSVDGTKTRMGAVGSLGEALRSLAARHIETLEA